MKKWIVSALISLASTTASAEDKPLNILFILTDDQAADTVHAFGNERISTPNIDSLAREGMTFTHVFNQGSWSGAVCAPSRRMINTGRHLFHTGMGPDDAKDGSDADGIKLFGETFRDEGYTTFMTGKWHLPMSIWERSFTHGKAIFKGGMSYKEKGGQWHATFSDYDASAKQEDRFAEYTGDKHTSEMIADAAVDFLSGKADDPFMMYVAFLAPHDPRQSPDDYVARYKGETIDLPANYMPEHPFDQGDHFIRDEILAPFPREPDVVKNFIGEYYAMIEHVSRPMMFRLIPEVMNGTHGKFKQVRMGKFRELELKSERPVMVHLDGEIFAGFNSNVTELQLNLLPKELRHWREPSWL